jgi:hypothetical protein
LGRRTARRLKARHRRSYGHGGLLFWSVLEVKEAGCRLLALWPPVDV